MHLQPFLYGSAELSDDHLRVRTTDYCSARDNHVSTNLRGEGRKGGRGERRKGEGGEKGGEKGRMERKEKRKGKGERGEEGGEEGGEEK